MLRCWRHRHPVNCNAIRSRRAGVKGAIYCGVLGRYGGYGLDCLYSSIVWEEQAYSGATGPGFALHSEIVAPYIYNYGTEEQKQRILPKLVSGEWVGALAMTEPSAGSDFANIKTYAKQVCSFCRVLPGAGAAVYAPRSYLHVCRARCLTLCLNAAFECQDGDDWIINGSKVFITNGFHSDVVIVCAKTATDKGAHGITLFIVEEVRLLTECTPLPHAAPAVMTGAPLSPHLPCFREWKAL